LPEFLYYAIFIAMTLRSFIAIEFPATIQDAIVRHTADLRQPFPDPAIRWIPPRNIHLTFKFLGGVASQDLELLARSLGEELGKMIPFQLSFERMGIFPNERKPRIIWIGIHTTSSLFSLHRKIELMATRLGHQAENRPFSPHVTIGRFGTTFLPGNIQKLLKILGSLDATLISPVEISSLIIFKSDLKPSGPVYTSLYTIPFMTTNGSLGISAK
jgi:2'-5' RNA ligase